MSSGFNCPHCATAVAKEGAFCCPGCESAYRLIHAQGLGRYYRSRILQAGTPLPTPDVRDEPADITRFVRCDPQEYLCELFLTVEGLHCGACVWLIEHVLAAETGMLSVRLNMSTRRLTLRWRGAKEDAAAWVARIHSLGYRARPYDPVVADDTGMREQKELLRALAVAGFAAGNIMLLSVALWSSSQDEMGVATRDLLHWISALIALPVLVYSGRPFFRSAWSALSHRRTTMDVPIALALIGASAMSLFETATHGEHAYFDSVSMLLFFLLTGRYLDRRARNRARAAAQDLLFALSSAATVEEDAGPRFIPARDIQPGMRLLVAAGERFAADGTVEEGASWVDTALITGESVPVAVTTGDHVHAGTVNLEAPLKLRVSAAQHDSLLAHIVRLMENAEQSNSRYVRLADRVAAYYTPVVHVLGALTFLYWVCMAAAPWQEALLAAITVLIITCPCALALAVPAAQVIASGRLFQQGILLKSGDALERLAAITAVVFDKTGTLTLGTPELLHTDTLPEDALLRAASLAQRSRHPLARALCTAVPHTPAAADVVEYPGEGLEMDGWRLGKQEFAARGTAPNADAAMELWLGTANALPVRFTFSDALRPDAAATVAALKEGGLTLSLLSGDREQTVKETAAACGIGTWYARQTPADKLSALTRLREEGKHVLMIGDGLNDAPALAAASVSMSPSSAADITQNAADIVFQGASLHPVCEAWATARACQRIIRQNLGFALLYNLVAVPLAMSGMITPVLAAGAMSGSSLVVILNALRLRRRH